MARAVIREVQLDQESKLRASSITHLTVESTIGDVRLPRGFGRSVLRVLHASEEDGKRGWLSGARVEPTLEVSYQGSGTTTTVECRSGNNPITRAQEIGFAYGICEALQDMGVDAEVRIENISASED